MKKILVIFVATIYIHNVSSVYGTNDTEDLLEKASDAYQRFQQVSQKITIESAGMKNEKITGKDITVIDYYRKNDAAVWKGSVSFYNADAEPILEDYLIRDYALPDQFIELGLFHERRQHWFAWGYLTKEEINLHRKEKLRKLGRGIAMDGVLSGNDNKTVIDLIAESPSKRLHEQTEMVKGITCSVLEAKTRRGLIKAWVAPEYGYNTLKWSVVKSPDDLHWDGKTMGELDWLGLKAEFEFDAIEKIGDEYVITSGQLKHDTQFKNEDGNEWSLYKYTRTNVDFNPDFEALGAFKVDLPENTVVWGRDVGANYQFVNGELIPFIDEYVIDIIDSEINGILQKQPQAIKPEKKADVPTPADESQEPAIEQKEILHNDFTKENESVKDKHKNTWLESPLWIIATVPVLGVVFYIIYRRRA